jgi:hypothetical protein
VEYCIPWGFGTLLGPEGTPVGCCLWPSLPLMSNARWPWFVGVCVGGGVCGGGVWLFVECCIVDASILLW